MNSKTIKLYLEPWKEEGNDEVKIDSVELLDDGIYQDGLEIEFTHSSDQQKRKLKLYTDVDIDGNGLVSGKLNGFISKDNSIQETEEEKNYDIEIFRTYLKKEITVSFESPYKEQPGVWINIEKKYEDLYRTYSIEYIMNNDYTNYIGVKITFNSLKIKTTYPAINIIIIGDKASEGTTSNEASEGTTSNKNSDSKEVNIQDNDIKIATDLDDLTEQVNSISPNTGITVNNVVFPLISENVYSINLADEISTNIECGKIIDNLYLYTKQNLSDSILICNFDDIDNVSESFCKAWAKLLLQTKCKVIPINMNVVVSNTFSKFIEANIGSEEE